MKTIDTAYFQEFINRYRIKQEERANKGLGLEYFGPKEMQMLLDKIPTFETEPVRHGYWQDGGCYEICSVCGADHDRYDDGGYLQNFAYCPACGAKMDAEESHNDKD